MKAFTLFIDILPKYINKHNTPLEAQVEYVSIFDVSTVTMQHLMKLKISSIRVYMKFLQVLLKV